LALLQKIRSVVHYDVFQGGSSMSDFKWRHFRGEIILSGVRWYCKYGISYRDLEEMMLERGLDVDHTTLYRWVQHYAPEMEKRRRWYWKPSMGYSWRVDETYVKVKGEWTYLYRAIDNQGHTVDFYRSPMRNTQAAKRFLAACRTSHQFLPITLH
jgi:IS6 family transposase